MHETERKRDRERDRERDRDRERERERQRDRERERKHLLGAYSTTGGQGPLLLLAILHARTHTDTHRESTSTPLDTQALQYQQTTISRLQH
jgi:hypothetical protein